MTPRLSERRTPWLPVLALLFNALVWGLSWWPLRTLEAHGLHALWSTALSYTLSMVCTLAVYPGAWRALVHHRGLWALAAATGLTNVCFNWAVTLGDVVRVVLLFYLMPVWAVLLAWWLLGERPTLRSVLRMGLAVAGVVVVLKPAGSAGPWPQGLADWLGLSGGLFFALVNVLLRRLSDVPADARVLSMFSGGAVLAGATALAGGTQGLVPGWPAPQLEWLVLALLMGVALLMGNVALQYGAARLNAHTAALVMLSEVVFASVSSVWLGAAALPLRVWLGGALILSAAAWSAMDDGADPPEADRPKITP